MVGMMTHAEVKARIILLKSKGLTVDVDFPAGLIEGFDAENLIAFQAINKGSGVWIVHHINTNLCQWQ